MYLSAVVFALALFIGCKSALRNSTKYSLYTEQCTKCVCRDGRDGVDGRDGMSVQGPPGRDGVAGRDGIDCIECQRGPIGAKGEPGIKGITGQRGPIGPQGKKGDTGLKGSTGATGKAGTNGKNGTPGAKGSKGDKGSTGIKGVCDSKVLKQMQDEIKYLKTKLEAGLYHQYTATQLQWQSLHMSAAAACRGSTAAGGSGPNANVVIARQAGKNCVSVCASTYYKICDAEVSLFGSIGKATGYKVVGSFYNYGCNSPHTWGDEVKAKESASIDGGAGYISYCCCRMP